MAGNFIQPGDTLTLTAPYTVASGAGAKVGSIFGVAWTTIGSSVATPSLSGGGRSTTVVTFSRSGTDYLRMCEFGGVGASLPDGNAEVLGYLRANAAAWGEV